MLNRIFKLLGLPIMALVLLVGFTSASFAAGPTWLPKGNQFKPGQHVYLDPALTSGNNPVNFDGLEAQLKAEGAKHGVEFFYVMALKGNEPKGNAPFAQERLDDLIGNWGGLSGFPADKAVIVLVIRLDTDWSKSSYAVNTSPGLASQGITADNLFPYLDQYGKNPNGGNPNALLPRMPKAFGLQIAKDANGLIVEHKAALVRQAEARKAEAERQRLAAIAEAERQAQEKIRLEREAREHAEFMEKLPMRLVMFGTPTLILLTLLLLFVLYRSNKSKAVAALESWKKQFEPGNQNYLELERAYWGFLKNQGEAWSSRFKDETLAVFKVAAQAYADLSVRINAALNLMSESEKEIASANIFSIGKLKRAAARLTVTPITITGETLPIEQRSMFGAMVAEATYAPEELLANIAQLFDTANKECASIKNSMTGANQNKEDIEGLIASVAATRAVLEERGLNFGPYEIGYNQLMEDNKTFLALLMANPLKAFEKSEVVETGVGNLKKTLDRAIALKDSLAGSTRLIEAAQAKIAQARSERADINYPEKPATPEMVAGGNTRLNEEGANPDTELGEAKEHLANCLQNLLAGKLDKANDDKASAEKSAADASKLVDTILAARAFVQKQVPVVRNLLNLLGGDLPASEQDVAALKAGFLSKNFDGEPKKLDTANAVFQRTDAALANIRKAFFEQRYVAARAALEKTGSDIQNARNGLVEVHTRLNQLIDLRKHSRDTVQTATELAGALSVKLNGNRFTTSAATDSTYAALKPVLLGLQGTVAQEISDWPADAASADKLLDNLKGVDKAIDNEKQAHALAVSRVETLAAAVQTASQNVAVRTTRQPAHTKLESARGAQSKVVQSMTLAKSDWNAIARAAESAKATADEATKLAQEDARLAREASDAISDAEQYVNGVDNKSYRTSKTIGGSSSTFGANVSADVGSARGKLSQARNQLSATEYESAKRSAAAAKTAADEADAAAARAVGAAIGAAIAVWEEAERRRKAEEKRKRDAEEAREAAERRRRDDNNSSGGGFSGGGGSIGGGFSGGGGSRGGGDF